MACSRPIEEEENFTRLVLLITKPCQKLLRACFERSVQATSPGQTIDVFLNNNRKSILQTIHGKHYKAKYFPQGGATSLDDWDILMLCHMATYLPPTVISPHLPAIKEMRNTMSHSTSGMVPSNEYLTHRKQIQDFIDAGLNYLNVHTFRTEISEEVRTIEMPIDSNTFEVFKLALNMFSHSECILQEMQGKFNSTLLDMLGKYTM